MLNMYTNVKSIKSNYAISGRDSWCANRTSVQMYPGNLNYPLSERKRILGDTPIFHWTMIIGGRLLSVILRIQFWKQEYPLSIILECKTHVSNVCTAKGLSSHYLASYLCTRLDHCAAVARFRELCGEFLWRHLYLFSAWRSAHKMVVELQVIWSKSPAKTVLKFPFPRWERSSHRKKKTWKNGSWYLFRHFSTLGPGHFLVKPPNHRRKGSWQFLAVSDKDVTFKWLVTKYNLRHWTRLPGNYKSSHDEIAIT